jgi:hypothetical protein
MSRARHEREASALRAEIDELRVDRDNLKIERDVLKEAAETAAHQVATGDEQQTTAAEDCREVMAGGRGEPLIEGGYATPTPLTLGARRDRERARELDSRLAELEAINRRCTCGGAA